LVFTGNQPALATLADAALATVSLTDVALASATVADDYHN
jgi:hypothetical protein